MLHWLFWFRMARFSFRLPLQYSCWPSSSRTHVHKCSLLLLAVFILINVVQRPRQQHGSHHASCGNRSSSTLYSAEPIAPQTHQRQDSHKNAKCNTIRCSKTCQCKEIVRSRVILFSSCAEISTCRLPHPEAVGGRSKSRHMEKNIYPHCS